MDLKELKKKTDSFLTTARACFKFWLGTHRNKHIFFLYFWLVYFLTCLFLKMSTCSVSFPGFLPSTWWGVIWSDPLYSWHVCYESSWNVILSQFSLMFRLTLTFWSHLDYSWEITEEQRTVCVYRVMIGPQCLNRMCILMSNCPETIFSLSQFLVVFPYLTSVVASDIFSTAFTHKRSNTCTSPWMI